MVGVGAHGSGRCEPTLSDMVERVELVDGTGAIRCFELGKDANEVMNAVRVSLGLFGVVFRVTIRVVTAFDVLHEDRFLTVDETLRQLPDLVQGNEYLDLYWMPFTERVWVRIWNRTDSPRVRRLPQGPWTGFSDRNHWGLWMTWLQTVALVPLDWLTRLAPRLTPSVCRMKMAMAAPGSRVVHINQATHFRSAIESYRVGCVEIAFEVDPAFDAVKRSWASVTREIEAWAERGSYPLHMVVNARFIGGSDCFLSPARGNALTAYIEILGNHRHPEWTAFASAVGREWLKLPKARPHWGKEYDFIPGIEAHVRAALGDDLRRFLRVRDELGVDPDRLFVNPFLDRLLGAGAASAGERRPPT
jgi:L-gulonolactone oxidase